MDQGVVLEDEEVMEEEVVVTVEAVEVMEVELEVATEVEVEVVSEVETEVASEVEAEVEVEVEECWLPVAIMETAKKETTLEEVAIQKKMVVFVTKEW